MNTIGENIRRLRNAADLTQSELAEKLSMDIGNICSGRISEWETSRLRPGLISLCYIARGLATLPKARPPSASASVAIARRQA